MLHFNETLNTLGPGNTNYTTQRLGDIMSLELDFDFKYSVQLMIQNLLCPWPPISKNYYESLKKKKTARDRG